jgi:integrase/recombinase XerD
VRTRAAAEKPRSFPALLAEHVEDLRARRWSPTAQHRAQHILPRLFLHLREEGIRDPRGVSEEHLLRFTRKLATDRPDGAKTLALHTQAAYLGAVKRFFAFLAKRDIILVDPSREIPLPKMDKLPRMVLTETQARRLMAAPFPGSAVGLRDRAALETLYGTAIRAGECRRLDLADLDLGQGTLLIRDGKGRKDRMVPIAGRALLALDVYLREARPELSKNPREGALFLTRFGTRLGRTMLDIIVWKHGKAAGIPRRISSHVLRHSCATHLLKGGADVRHVQELLGHKSLQSTQLYTRVGVEDLRAVLARAHPRERSRRKRRRR